MKVYQNIITLKLSFEKLKPAIIFKLSRYINIDCISENLCKSLAKGPSYGNYQPFSNRF